MKKSIILILLSFLTITVSAQVNWVVRAGIGNTSAIEKREYGFELPEVGFSPSLSAGIESSITLRKGSSWVFSPSLNVNLGFGAEETSQVYLSSLFGVRIRTGQGCSFVPKFGFVFGYTMEKTLDDIVCDDIFYTDRKILYTDRKIKNSPMIAPGGAFVFELKRIVLGINAFYAFGPEIYSDSNSYPYNYGFLHADLTIGYKF